MNNLNPRHSLRARIGLTFGSLILLLALLLSFVIERPAERQIEQDIGNSLASMALQVADRFNEEVIERVRDLHLLANLSQIRDPATPIANKQALLAQVVQSQPEYAWLGLASMDGTVAASSGLLPLGLDVSERDWFQHGQRRPYVGESEGQLVEEGDGEHLVALAVPLTGLEDAEGGVLAAFLDWQGSPSQGSAWLATIPDATGVDIFLIAADGHLLYSSTSSESPSPTQSRAVASRAAASGQTYGFSSVLWQGEPAYLTGYARMGQLESYSSLDWVVLVRQNQVVAFAPVRRLQVQILLWGAGLGVLFLLLGWFLAGRVVRPLSGIAVAADRIRAGDMRAEIPEQPGSDEIATLSHSLRTMVETLDEQKANVARNRELLEQRVQERTRTLTALYQVLETANVAEDLPAALQQALAPVLEATGGEAAFIHLSPADDLFLAARQGVSAEGIASWRRQQRAADPLAEVVATQTPLFRSGISGPETDSGSQLSAYIGVPIMSGGRLHGVLSVLGRGSRPFVEGAVALLTSVADEFGVIVENARLQERAEQLAVLEERNRLARELHDSVTQSLYSLTLFAEAGRRMLAEGELEASKEFFGDVGDTSQQALKEMRLLLHKLRPAALQQEGFLRALRQRLNAVEERSGIANELDVKGNLALSPEQEEVLYHITTEALNNALRHAHASRVRVTVRNVDGAVELLVSDNGQGFEPATAGDSGGMGMVNMQERARHAGGQLTVESTPGQGTTVRVRLPLRGNDKIG